MNLSEKVSEIHGIGPLFVKRLKKLDIETVNDLLYHVPSRYIDYSLISIIASLQEGETVTLRGEIKQIKNNYIRGRRLTIQKAILYDGTGTISISWFNQPYLAQSLQGKIVSVSGKVIRFGRSLNLVSPEYEIVKEGATIHTGRLVPVYPETYGISSKWLRAKIANILPKTQIFDPLPKSLIEKYGLLDLKTALFSIHLPKTSEEIDRARKRLAFDELFYIQLTGFLRKKQWRESKLSKKIEIKKYLPEIQQFVRDLPFELTKAQKVASKEILVNLSKNTPMNRLLQGDVGSGKTVVSAIAIYACHLNGQNCLFMAPTEILALQHYQTLKKLLSPYMIKIALKTASYQKGGKSSNLTIGTHALLHSKKPFRNIALVVIDEQHRFGVEQRALLKGQKTNPHFLTMTATPIPRTVALVLYGELDLSVISEMPKGRKIVKTYVVPREKYQAAYNWIKKKIKKGRAEGRIEQAYIIYPLIEESEILTEVKAAKEEYQRLKRDVFPDLRLGLLHGKLPAEEKNKTIDNFRKGNLDILIATSVVEVGMDIPNATIILIEGADRFGLSQLHQLRGRVGRSDKESYCLLFSEKPSRRLKAMEKYFSGLKLSEIDLKIRGAGEVYGTKQHGYTDLKFADLTDIVLINQTQKATQEIVDRTPQLKSYSLLQEKIKPFLDKKVQPD